MYGVTGLFLLLTIDQVRLLAKAVQDGLAVKTGLLVKSAYLLTPRTE